MRAVTAAIVRLGEAVAAVALVARPGLVKLAGMVIRLMAVVVGAVAPTEVVAL
jgi:hypothetical protein